MIHTVTKLLTNRLTHIVTHTGTQ